VRAREGERRVQCKAFPQPFDCLGIARTIVKARRQGLKEQCVCIDVPGRALLDSELFRRRKGGLERTRDLLRDLALNGEHVRQIAVVLLRP
jgi:hypothetical protein